MLGSNVRVYRNFKAEPSEDLPQHEHVMLRANAPVQLAGRREVLVADYDAKSASVRLHFVPIGRLLTRPAPRTTVRKVKFSHSRYRALGPELIPVYRQSARR